MKSGKLADFVAIANMAVEDASAVTLRQDLLMTIFLQGYRPSFAKPKTSFRSTWHGYTYPKEDAGHDKEWH